MGNWAGHATLVQEARESRVQCSYVVTATGPGHTWEGSFAGHSLADVPEVGTATLRLDDGREGQVVISDVSIGSDGSPASGSFRGNGAAPG